MKGFNYKSILFNVIEFIMIITVGWFILPISIMLLIIAIFTFVRETIGGAKHYKSPYKCMIWSFLIMESLFLVTRIDFLIGICFTIFAGILLSKGGDIAVFEYNNKEDNKKYRELKLYIESHKNTQELKEFENIIINFNKKYDDRFKINLYKIYQLIFYENMSYKDVKKEMHLRDDNHIIVDALDMIFICFDTYVELGNHKNLDKEKELVKKD